MATIRIETAQDARTGLVYANIFTDDATEPTLKSEAIWDTHEHLVGELMKLLRTRMPDHTSFADDPTIGV